jgi:hypothetical protein
MNYTTPFNASEVSTDAPEAEVIASRSSWTWWRYHHYLLDDGHMSQWLNLTEGEQYYMSGIAGSSWMSVGVEFTNSSGLTETVVVGEDCDCVTVNTTNSTTNETTSTEDCTCTDTTEEVPVIAFTGHPHAIKAVQQIAYEHSVTLEEWAVTITNPDDGTYTLNFVDNTGDTPSLYTTASIRASASASTFRQRIKGFFDDVHDSDVSVTRQMYNSTGLEVDTYDENVTSIVYTIKTLKLIDGFSTSGIQAVKVADSDRGTSKTAATITIITPSQGVQSSPPFNGTYAITCTSNTGASYTTRDIEFHRWDNHIEKVLVQDIPFLVDSVQVVSDYRYSYK